MAEFRRDYTEYDNMQLYALTDAELDGLIVKVANETWEDKPLQDIYLDRLRSRVQARKER